MSQVRLTSHSHYLVTISKRSLKSYGVFHEFVYKVILFLTYFTLVCMIYVTRFYKTDSNYTSAKIKLMSPLDSYAIVLLVLTYYSNYSRLALTDVFLGGVESLNGGSGLVKGLAWQESVVGWWMA